MIKLKIIEYKIDVVCYLSFYPLGLGLKPSYQA